MVFWVVETCSVVVGNRRFGRSATSIFRDEVRGLGDVFTKVLPLRRGS